MQHQWAAFAIVHRWATELGQRAPEAVQLKDGNTMVTFFEPGQVAAWRSFYAASASSVLGRNLVPVPAQLLQESAALQAQAMPGAFGAGAAAHRGGGA